jgi:hypothetical protein
VLCSDQYYLYYAQKHWCHQRRLNLINIWPVSIILWLLYFFILSHYCITDKLIPVVQSQKYHKLLKYVRKPMMHCVPVSQATCSATWHLPGIFILKNNRSLKMEAGVRQHFKFELRHVQKMVHQLADNENLVYSLNMQTSTIISKNWSFKTIQLDLATKIHVPENCNMKLTKTIYCLNIYQ